MGSSLRLVDHIHPVNGFAAAVPSSAAPAYVNLANYGHVTIAIQVTNATTVTGSAVTLTQATAVAGTGAKSLAFAKVFVNLDTAAGDTLVETVVASNTFTTLTTNSKNALYIIEIDAADLDVVNGFNCLKVSLANATAATLSVVYYLSGSRFGGNVLVFPTAVA